MWDWYSRPGGWHDRANVPLRRVVLLMVAAGVLMGVTLFVLYAVLASLIFSRVPH